MHTFDASDRIWVRVGDSIFEDKSRFILNDVYKEEFSFSPHPPYLSPDA
jgi:hypothetical protein